MLTSQVFRGGWRVVVGFNRRHAEARPGGDAPSATHAASAGGLRLKALFCFAFSEAAMGRLLPGGGGGDCAPGVSGLVVGLHRVEKALFSMLSGGGWWWWWGGLLPPAESHFTAASDQALPGGRAGNCNL